MDIEFLKQIKRKENLLILRQEIDKTWVATKIENHLKRNPHIKTSLEEVKEAIKKNDLIASFFIKEPGRQNLSENIIADFISKIKNVKDFINHGSSVNLFLVKGKITKIRTVGIKSIDYTWSFKGRKVFASQKYTNERGGAQDNQYNDIVSFLQNTEGNSEHLFFAIVDGEYYTEEKINVLKKYERDNVKICSINNLEKVLNEFK